MAKSKLNYTKTIINKMSIKGVLSDNGTIISYIDEDDVVREIKVLDCFAAFSGKEIDFALSEKTNEDLDVEVTDDDYDDSDATYVE